MTSDGTEITTLGRLFTGELQAIRGETFSGVTPLPTVIHYPSAGTIFGITTLKDLPGLRKIFRRLP